MSPLATLTLAWSALYAYASAYYVLLYLRQRSDREYLAFGRLCAALAIYAFGGAFLDEATSVADGSFAVAIQYVGACATVPWFIDFAAELGGRHRRDGLAVGAYVWAFAGLGGAVLGLWIDPDRPGPPPAWGFAAAPDYPEPAFTVAGHLHVVTGAALAGTALSRLWAHGREDRDVRLVVGSAFLGILAGAHDVLVRVAALRSPYLLEHAAILAVLAMSWVLLRRFEHAGAELAARTEEVGRSLQSLRDKQLELVRKEQLAAVGELSAVIAHEVRNPLAIIKNAVSGLRRRTLAPQDRTTLLSILAEETDRLDRLVRDLLTYARPVAPGREPVALAPLVDGALAATGASDGRVAISVRLHPDHAAVPGDPELLARAVANVIDNALHAMREGGALQIWSEPAVLDGQPAVALAVRDSGEGMDTLVRAKARDPFFTTRSSGTGLGLAIVDRVVRTHRGTLSIESGHGLGTTVRLVLPEQP